MLVEMNPQRVYIDDGILQYSDIYENFQNHAIGYFTELPSGCLQYHRSGDPVTLEYKVSNSTGKIQQIAADSSLIAEVDNVLANLGTIIANQTDANTPEAELDLLNSDINQVVYGQPLNFNLLYNKTIPQNHTMDIIVTSPNGDFSTWVTDVNQATEPLEMLFTQAGLWALKLLDVSYSVEVK